MKKFFSIALVLLLLFSNLSISLAGTITSDLSNPEVGQVITVTVVSDTTISNSATIIWIIKIGEDVRTITQNNVQKTDSKYVSSITLEGLNEGEVIVDAEIRVVQGSKTLVEQSDEIIIYVSEATQINDTMPPVIRASYNIDSNELGWFNKDVTVTFTAEDESEIEWLTVNEVLFDQDGVHEFIAKAKDSFGNEGELKVEVKLDKTLPEITVTSPLLFALNQSNAKIDFDVNDNLSGFESGLNYTGYQNIDTSKVGKYSFNIEAVDLAGNKIAKNVNYQVVYDFNGIQQPINSDGSSVFKAGSTIPVKFKLSDNEGSPVSTAIARISYVKITDGVEGDVTEAISTSAATTGNLFRYDSNDEQYIFNLSTKGQKSGTYELRILLDDGTVQTVKIGLK